MKEKSLKTTILELEREVRDLKTFQGGLKTVEAFTYTFTPSGVSGRFKITYSDGADAIITQIYSGASSWLSKIENNIQYFWLQAQAATQVLVVSTRPILSVEYESNA